MNYYITDGTLPGFYTAAFDAYTDRASYLTSCRTIQTQLGDTFTEVRTDESKANRVCATLTRYDRECLWEIDRILRSPDEKREQIAFAYLKLICKEKMPVRRRLSDNRVLDVTDILDKISRELDHLHGFLRFTENSAGVLYAPCEPDNNIIDLLTPHFVARIKSFPFLIHDKKRNLATLYDTKTWALVQLVGDAEFIPSQTEEEMQSLWKKYYDSIGIRERQNTRLMKRCMPVRYWKYLPEKQ